MKRTAIEMGKIKGLLIVAGFISASGLLFGLPTAGAASIPITLVNASFEDPNIAADTESSTDPSGWNIVSPGGVYLADGTFAVKYYGEPIPNGSQVVEIGSGSAVWQNTGVTMAAGNTYKLSVSASAYTPSEWAWGYLYAADNSTDLGSQVASLRWTTSSTNRTWAVYDVSYTCDSAHAGKYLTVRLGVNNSAYIGFDSASASFIPEPGALALLVIGGIGMLIRRRRA